MPTPSKPVIVLQTEKKSHRTKAEIAQRSEAEQSLSSGVAFRERPRVRGSQLAHKEYLRLNKLFKNIQKNDALFEGIINRYCLLLAECEEFEGKREMFYNRANELADHIPEGANVMEYYSTLARMQAQVISCDKQIMQKRKMMLEIEKECVMTIAAALRAIPKKSEDSEDEDPMASLIGSRRA